MIANRLEAMRSFNCDNSTSKRKLHLMTILPETVSRHTQTKFFPNSMESINRAKFGLQVQKQAREPLAKK